MAPSEAHHIFLPWLRQGLSADAPTEDTLGAGVPGRMTMQVQMKVNNVTPTGAPDPVQVRLYSPGDVIGIEPQAILRTEPQPRFPIFEPNYFAFIEFRRPDFPWLFTPARANSQGQLRPWLCLVVVPRKAGVTLSVEPRRPLPILECPRAELPNLAESWAWAHSQITRPTGGSTLTIDQILRTYPDNALSRLMSPRRLDPATTYLACLVPAFASGLKAGLGDPLTAQDEAELQPAWLPLAPTEEPTTSIRLPVYYHWEFTTGVAGDFEALVRRLQVRILPPPVGIQTVDLHAPGWGMPDHEAGAPGTLLEMGAVFGTPTTRPAAWDASAHTQFQNALRAILNGPPDSGGSPVVKPPLYGQEYARADAIPATNTPPHWWRELNLDPRYRIAAGLGAMIIRYEQERLMESAWQQLAAASHTLQEQRRRQFGAVVNGAMESKRLDALSISVAASGFRSLEGGGGMERALLSTANGSFARRLQARRQLAPDAGALLLSPNGGEAGARSLDATNTTPEAYRFSPTFAHPILEWIRDYFPDLLLPGLSQVPPNTIALLESNPAILEAFMVGLNHEMGRELLWREFPVDRRGTYFRNVWDDAAAANELPPIADWSPDSHLGDHLQQGINSPPDPALEAQIQAAQSQSATLRQQIETAASQRITLQNQRELAYAEGAEMRTQLEQLRSDEVLIPTRQLERTTAINAGNEFEAQAEAAEANAVAIRATQSDLLAQIAALQVIAAQIPPVEANLQGMLDQIADLTDQIEGIPALTAQLTAQRTAAQQAITTAQQTIAETETLVLTLPHLQQQRSAAQQEADGYRAQGNAERLLASQIRATADPARQRLREIEVLAEEVPFIKDKIEALNIEIPRKEHEIFIHRLHEPPRPPDEKGLQPEAEELMHRGPGFPGPGIPDPYEDWYEWHRRLLELEAELEFMVRDLADQHARLEYIAEQLEEIPALQAQIETAERDAAPHDLAADAAYRQEAEAIERVNGFVNQIGTILGRQQQIPALQQHIQTQTDTIVTLTQQLEGLPAHQNELEGWRAAAQEEADAISANLAALEAQIVELPSLQAQFAAIEAEAVAEEQRAVNSHQRVAEERAKIAPLTTTIAALQAGVANLPAVRAQVQADAAAVAVIDQQLQNARSEQNTRLITLATTEGTLNSLLNERALSRSQLILVIRGDLLRRFARARIYAVEGMWTNSAHTQKAPNPNAIPLQPLFRQSWGNDVTFFGFTMTGKTARGTGGHPGWYFVLEEPPTSARFGLDSAEGDSRAVADIGAWETLRWNDLVDHSEALADLFYVSPYGRLDHQSRPLFTNPGNQPSVQAEWGRNSAHLALITRQRPARLEIHASLWLP